MNAATKWMLGTMLPLPIVQHRPCTTLNYDLSGRMDCLLHWCHLHKAASRWGHVNLRNGREQAKVSGVSVSARGPPPTHHKMFCAHLKTSCPETSRNEAHLSNRDSMAPSDSSSEQRASQRPPKESWHSPRPHHTACKHWPHLTFSKFNIS